MKPFPKGTPPEVSVKDLELLWFRPEYKTNTRIVHWCGADLEDGDPTIDEILDIIKEKDNPEDLAFWANGTRFVLAHVNFNEPKNG